MKSIVLSDHAADQLRKNEAAREGRYLANLKAYEAGIHEKQDALDDVRRRRTLAAMRRQYVKMVGYFLAVVWARCAVMMARRGKPVRESAGAEDETWAYGRQGEEAFDAALGRVLDDAWTVLSGYHNPHGEIDRILVGPRGIFGFEVKNVKGVIYCNGDEWWRDKEDAWGNVVRRGEKIEDRGGRGPSRQVNEPCDMLERFLARTIPACKIFRGVVFTEPSVQFGDVKNVTVGGVYHLGQWDFGDVIRRSVFRLGPEDVTRVVKQIERDHLYHQQRRNNRRARHPAAVSPGPDLAPAN
jgi:hypothetical protein